MSILQTIMGWFGSNGKQMEDIEQAPTVTTIPQITRVEPVVQVEQVPALEVKNETQVTVSEIIESAPPVEAAAPIHSDLAAAITNRSTRVKRAQRNGSRRRKSRARAAE